MSCFFMASCSRYEDGPIFSLESKKKRLEGKWKLKYINSKEPQPEEFFETVFTSCGTNVHCRGSKAEKLWFDFRENGNFSVSSEFAIKNIDLAQTRQQCAAVYQEFSSEEEFSGEWEFNNRKKELEVLYAGESAEYEITRLTSKELWLEKGNREFQFEKTKVKFVIN